MFVVIKQCHDVNYVSTMQKRVYSDNLQCNSGIYWECKVVHWLLIKYML